MNSNLNEIVCIVDRSGSMGSIAKDAIGGFNTFLADQKTLPGEAKLSLVLFDNEYLLPVDNQPIQSVEPLTDRTFVPRGSTALFDAIGRTITTIGERLAKTIEADRPAQVIVAILTDGEENASHEYGRERIAEMIKHQQEAYNWQFIFLAANMDAFAQASALNIPVSNAANFVADAVGTRNAYDTISNLTTSYRVGNNSGNSAFVTDDKTTAPSKKPVGNHR